MLCCLNKKGSEGRGWLLKGGEKGVVAEPPHWSCTEWLDELIVSPSVLPNQDLSKILLRGNDDGTSDFKYIRNLTRDQVRKAIREWNSHKEEQLIEGIQKMNDPEAMKLLATQKKAKAAAKKAASRAAAESAKIAKAALYTCGKQRGGWAERQCNSCGFVEQAVPSWMVSLSQDMGMRTIHFETVQAIINNMEHKEFPSEAKHLMKEHKDHTDQEMHHAKDPTWFEKTANFNKATNSMLWAKLKACQLVLSNTHIHFMTFQGRQAAFEGCMDNGDPTIREAACRGLALIGKAGLPHAPAMAKRIESEPSAYPAVTVAAIHTLVGMGDEVALHAPSVATRLMDSRKEVRKAAALAIKYMAQVGLERFDSEHIAEKLQRRLHDSDPYTRIATMEALVALEDEGEKYASVVAEKLKDYHPDVLRAAIRALGFMNDAGARYAGGVAKLIDNKWVRQTAIQVLGDMGKPGEPYAKLVAERLQDSNEEVRKAALSALGKMGEAGAAHSAAALNASSDWRVVSSAIALLSNMGRTGAATANIVASKLEDADEDVRRVACEALGNMGDAGAAHADKVKCRLKDEDSDVRQAACVALSHMGEAGAVYADSIAEILEDEFELVRVAASEALGLMGNSGARHVSAVAARLEDACRRVRKAAVDALSGMGKRAAEYAAERLEHNIWHVREAACEALSQLGNTGASQADRVATFLTDEAWQVRKAACSALRAMGHAGMRHSDAIAKCDITGKIDRLDSVYVY